MATQSYIVQKHNHDLTSLLSISETQQQVNSRSNDLGLNFNQILVDITQSGGATQYRSFSKSDNLYNDMVLIEKQIQNILNSRASTTKFGLVRIDESSGLTATDGVLSADFSTLQPKIVDSGDSRNFKSLKDKGGNVISLLYDSSDTSEGNDGYINIVTVDDLNTAMESQSTSTTGELTGIKNTIDTLSARDDTLADLIHTNQQDITNVQSTVSVIQNEVVDILSEIQGYSGLSGASSSSGSVICPRNTLQTTTCENIILNESKQYYRKKVSESLASCVEENESTSYFNFDTSMISTNGSDYMVIKFYLDLEMITGGSCPDPLRLPWIWVKENGTRMFTDAQEQAGWSSLTATQKSLLPVIFNPSQITNVVVEIRGYWKCNTWTFYGKLAHQYYINCSD